MHKKQIYKVLYIEDLISIVTCSEDATFHVKIPR